jgi:hypothetical protein
VGKARRFAYYFYEVVHHTALLTNDYQINVHPIRPESFHRVESLSKDKPKRKFQGLVRRTCADP